MRTQQRTLARIIAVRVVMVAALVALVLAVVFFTKYMSDTPWVRRATLEADKDSIVDSLSRHDDPSLWAIYRDYPDSYGFRVFDNRSPGLRRLVSQANPNLLPPVSDNDAEGTNGGDIPQRFPQGVREGFAELPPPQRQPGSDRWVLTDHADIGPHSYWVQVVMANGDPAWRWRDPLGDEMIEHVVVPVLSLVAPLTLALLLTTRRELRPLVRISRQVEALGNAVRTGAPLAPLAEENLPLEISRFVAAINAVLASLERSLQHQRQFTSDAAHELRTPLAVLALELSELPPSPLAERLTTEIRALADLVNQLLRLAQAEDLMMAARQDADIVQISRRVCEDLVPEAIAHRLSLAFLPQVASAVVRGNAGLLDIAIRNIVQNAVKLSPAGTLVRVRVTADRVIVEDRGPGVPDEYKERIFDRFWRAAGQTAGGSGVGLALVRRIAQLHGGDVCVQDREGGGARFILSLATADMRAGLLARLVADPIGCGECQLD